MGRLISETSSTGWLLYEYDPLGRRTTRTGPDGLTTYTYAPQGQVESITNGAMNVRFQYDDASRMTAAFPPNGVTITYAYDAANQLDSHRLRRAWRIREQPQLFLRHQWPRVFNLRGTNLATPLPNPQTASCPRNRVDTLNDRHFTYTPEGQLLADGVNSYSWNNRGDLITTLGITGSTNYKYNGFNNRTAKTELGTASYYFAVGKVMSVLLATQGSPWFSSTAPSTTRFQGMSGP